MACSLEDEDDKDLLVRNEDSATRGNSLNLQKRNCKSATRFSFYTFRIVDLWNFLPQDIINVPTDTFKARLDSCWSGPQIHKHQVGHQAIEITKQGLSRKQ